MKFKKDLGIGVNLDVLFKVVEIMHSFWNKSKDANNDKTYTPVFKNKYELIHIAPSSLETVAAPAPAPPAPATKVVKIYKGGPSGRFNQSDIDKLKQTSWWNNLPLAQQKAAEYCASINCNGRYHNGPFLFTLQVEITHIQEVVIMKMEVTPKSASV